MLARRPYLLGAVFTAASLCGAVCADAQTGLSVSLDSDDRFRGLSLSDGKPTLSLNLAYDHPSGVYLGASAIGVNTAHQGAQLLGYTAYAGYAARTKAGFTWDVGASNANVTSFRYGRYSYNYTEFYAGLLTDHLSGHVYVSPNYLGENLTTVYADLDATLKPVPQVRLFGHVGVLAPLSGRSRLDAPDQQFDLRAGVAGTYKSCELQLAWTTTTRQAIYPADYRQGRNAILLSASYFF